MTRWFRVWSFYATAAVACDCDVPSVAQARKDADVVFRGTVSEINAGTVLFRVSRVWKGAVRRAFTMPELRETSACLGFWPRHLQVGNELLVYANWLPPKAKDGAYFTSICTRTRLLKDASEDLLKLGAGGLPHQ